MKEVKHCSISGIAFTMEVDAYATLEHYLNKIKEAYNSSADGDEIVSDIEARIAELILTTQAAERVVEMPLVLNIIAQMGTVEDITDKEGEGQEEPKQNEPRIPRRLYRDIENGKLGGVCSGIARYFGIDAVWIRLSIFSPLVISSIGWIPFMGWLSPIANLFAVFVICYIVLWFAIPAARTARQKLEQDAEPITAQSIGDKTAEIRNDDLDARTKPLLSEIMLRLGQVTLFVLKVLAVVVGIALLLAICALIIGGFAIVMTMNSSILWVPVMGVLVALMLVLLLTYVVFCFIASRKPSAKVLWGGVIAWIISIIALGATAIAHDDFNSHNFVESIQKMNISSSSVKYYQTPSPEEQLQNYLDDKEDKEGKEAE